MGRAELERGHLRVELLPRSTLWLDTETFSDLSDDELASTKKLIKSGYGAYLLQLLG